MKTETKVINFINHFKEMYPKQIEDMFLHGLCYWFSHILKTQFDGEQYYDPVGGHFITKIEDHFYDIRGNVDNEYLGENEDIVNWNEYQEYEDLDSSRVIKYCKDLKE